MINKTEEVVSTKRAGRVVVKASLGPIEGENLAEFNHRMELYVEGIHQIFIRRINDAEYLLEVELNPSFDEPEPADFSNVDQNELLKELHQTAAAVHDNKIDYDEGR